jgi:alpha-beta hydrolase superfamily lysophospholipase
MSFEFLERPPEPRLAYRVDAPSGNARGAVLLVHGFAEHSARYDNVVRAWCERGLVVARFDLRGHGRSEGPRGHIDSFADYLRDVTDVLSALGKNAVWPGSKKPVLFGHSMGGLVAAHAALLLGDRVAGLAMTSPFFAVARPVPKHLLLLAKIGSRIAPKLRQPSGLSGKDLTHDAAIAKAYDEDPLGFPHVTTRWFAEIGRAQEELFARAPSMKTRLYCIASGDDRAASVDATRRFFARVGTAPGDRELVVRDDLYHEVLNEPVWPELASLLANRMLRWSESAPG